MGVAELEERTGSVGAIIVIGPIRREDDLIRLSQRRKDRSTTRGQQLGFQEPFMRNDGRIDSLETSSI